MFSKIDGRKAEQDFYNRYSGKRIYCHKVKGRYSVGINGTSLHKGNMDRWQAQEYVSVLVNTKLKG